MKNIIAVTLVAMFSATASFGHETTGRYAALSQCGDGEAAEKIGIFIAFSYERDDEAWIHATHHAQVAGFHNNCVRKK